MPKTMRTKPINGAPNLMSATDAEHAKQRKLLSHAFSDQALREQELLLRSYADLLVKQLRSECDEGNQAVEMTDWLTFTTFDIVGDLSFGKPFDNLASKTAHPWVATFKHSIMQGILFVAFRTLLSPFWDKLCLRLLSSTVQAKRPERFKHAQSAVAESLKRKTERPDFISHCLRYDDARAVPQAELESMFTIVVLAGCESPATTLSGMVYYLLRNPEPLGKLQDEIRSLSSEDDITFANMASMTYLKAVIDESMRVYPPVPATMVRVVPGNGAKVRHPA